VCSCTDIVLLSSVQVSQDSGEKALKGLSQSGTKEVTSKKQIPKRATELTQYFLLRSAFPSPLAETASHPLISTGVQYCCDILQT